MATTPHTQTYARKRQKQSEHSVGSNGRGKTTSSKVDPVTPVKKRRTADENKAINKPKQGSDSNVITPKSTPSPKAHNSHAPSTSKTTSHGPKSASVWAELDSVLESAGQASKSTIKRSVTPRRQKHVARRPLPGTIEQKRHIGQEKVAEDDIDNNDNNYYQNDQDRNNSNDNDDNDNDFDDSNNSDEKDEQLVQSPRSNFKNRLKFLSSLSKRTYGGGRTIAKDKNDGDDLDDFPLTKSAEDSRSMGIGNDDEEETQQDSAIESTNFGSADDHESNNDNSILNISNINDLKAQGVNTEFLSDVEYIMEGLDMSVGAQISTLVELAEKCHDETGFIHNFKSTKFPVELFRKVGKSEDEVVNFLLGWLANQLLEDGDGLALLLIRDFTLIESFLSMLDDDQDIRKKLGKKGSSRSKAVTRLIERVVPGNELMVVSRQWVALNGLFTLQSMSTSVQFMLQEKLQGKFGRFLKLLDRQNNDNEDNDNDNDSLGKTNVTLLTAQLTFMAQSLDPKEIISVLEEQDDGDGIEFLIRSAQSFFESSISASSNADHSGGPKHDLEIATIEAILKLAVLLSTQFAVENVLHYSVYNVDMAVALCGYIGCAAQRIDQLPGAILAYSAGLLYNLVESDRICQAIQQMNQERLRKFKQMILTTPVTKDDTGNIKTAVSYLYLVLKRLDLSTDERHQLDQLIENNLDKTVARMTAK